MGVTMSEVAMAPLQADINFSVELVCVDAIAEQRKQKKKCAEKKNGNKRKKINKFKGYYGGYGKKKSDKRTLYFVNQSNQNFDDTTFLV
jgi:hypothetical protein